MNPAFQTAIENLLTIGFRFAALGMAGRVVIELAQFALSLHGGYRLKR